MRGAHLVALALLASTPALAAESYMWGIGPRVGTNAIPGAYPVAFPKQVKEDGTIPKVRADVMFGADAVYYITKRTRLSAMGGMGLGKGFTDLHSSFRYNYVGQTGALDLLVGGGAGFGTMTFRGEDGSNLRVPYYPLRAEASALLRDEWRGYQASIFGQLNVPSNHFYENSAGEEVDVRGTPFNYATVGIEFAVFFGDFTPPKPKRRD